MARAEPEADPAAPARSEPRPIWPLLAITLAVLALVFLSTPAEQYPGDAEAVRVETVILLNSGQWAIPGDIAVIYGERGQYFFQNARGNWYPKYGALNTLIYAPALWLEKIATGTLEISPARRLIWLNLWNLILSGTTAFYFALLARRYTRSDLVAAIAVLASLLCTFWWHYLRVQTFEIYLTLFLLAFFYHFINALTSPQARAGHKHFLVAAIYFGALCLCKTVYVALLPAILFILLRNLFSNPLTERKKRAFGQFLYFWLPVGFFLGLLAGLNWFKFDSPFATGYTQWEKESRLFDLSNVLAAIPGYLFSPHHSVFRHFPLLLLALPGWPAFVRKYRTDAIVAGLFILALFLVSAAFVNWRGESSYGPRYLLPVLPLAGLPFIEYLEWLRTFPRMAKSILATTTAVLLAYALMLQLCVNTLPFFFCYSLKEILDDKQRSGPALYLRSRTFGTIDRDFILYRMGRASPFTTQFLDRLNSDELQRMSELNDETVANYYWFPNILDRLGSASAKDGIGLE